MIQHDQKFEQRIVNHYNACNSAHVWRSRQAGKNACLDVTDLLCVVRAFQYKCPWCQRDLKDIEHLCFNHFWRIENTGHALGTCVISCVPDNVKLSKTYHDNPDELMIAYGRDPEADFWERIKRAFFERDLLWEAQLKALDDQPNLIDRCVAELAERLAKSAESY